jgi:catechol 2,3-dioxygenase-like lactoylglutathione lyase family enzyme
MRFEARLGSAIAVAVRDLEPVVSLYEEGLGLGPFERREVPLPGARYADDHAAPACVSIATAPLGVCEMELIETLAGRPPHAEFLETHGEGMNHFNLDKCTAEAYLDTLSALYWRGIEPFWGLPFGSFCYVESESIGGVTFEVMVGSGHAGKKGHNHLGLVVEDTPRTIEFYTETLGLPPFRTGEFPMARGFYRSERIETRFRASFCDIGEAQLQLFQVLEGETPFSDRLARTGEGMHHLCLNVPDLDAALGELAAVGVPETWRAPELGLAELDTRRIGGMTFALHRVG